MMYTSGHHHRVDASSEDQSVELDRMRRLPPGEGEALPAYAFDLTAHEQRRLAAVLAGTPDFEPAAALAAEAEAHRMLYSGLDAEQRATYQMLVDAGVLDA
jgi:hypothetical protein